MWWLWLPTNQTPLSISILTAIEFQRNYQSRAPTLMMNGGSSVRRNDHHIQPESSLLLHFRSTPNDALPTARANNEEDDEEEEITIVTYKCETGSDAASLSPALLIRPAEVTAATTATTGTAETNLNPRSLRRLALPAHLNSVNIHYNQPYNSFHLTKVAKVMGTSLFSLSISFSYLSTPTTNHRPLINHGTRLLFFFNLNVTQ